MAFFTVSTAARRRYRLRTEITEQVENHLPAELDPEGPDLPEVDYLTAEQTAATLAWAQTQLNRLDALLTALAGHAETIGAARTLHAGSTTTLLAAVTGTNPAVAAARVNTAATLTQLPVTAAAYTDGQINTAHVHTLTAAHDTIGLTGREDGLVDLSALTAPADVKAVVQVILDQENPDAVEADHTTQRARREVRLSWRRDGMLKLHGLLTADDGARLVDTLAQATDPPTADDPRTPAQRRADALADLIDAAAANTHPLGVSSVSLLVDAADFTDATTVDGTHLPAHLLDYHTCTAAIAVIFGTGLPAAFKPLKLARTARRASTHQWAALIARDRGCIRCGRTPRYCHAHHIHHWAHGGNTDLENLVLLCSRCHHDLHLGHYTITMHNGLPTITPTTGRAPPAA